MHNVIKPTFIAEVTVTVTSAALEATDTSAATCAPPVTVTVTAATAAATTSAATAAASPAAGQNLQTFTGNRSLPPAVTTGGKGFVVTGDNDGGFINLSAALQRSCSIQHNACADVANSGGGFAVSQCDQQETQCEAAAA
ncbi:hypothetical protein GYMLUDRAFT_515999 [Collybiopsis luxurians FD-317 M1]|nr:hypothetical protein GYMLUDRAFT_515999 [Collybiopsis luxurians FD-317 M1]